MQPPTAVIFPVLYPMGLGTIAATDKHISGML